jgi:hypothetical protein
MHISLDSALGRQRRLNSVGESVLQIAPNAAAAYSLRSLTGGDPKVVRVRRASDNGERDFTSSEITSGEMVSWVNRQVIAPLDIQALEADGRTGDFLIAKAAYALRSLGTRQATITSVDSFPAPFTSVTGKFVVQVRRSSDDTFKSFTADEVTDGTLLAFVNTPTNGVFANTGYESFSNASASGFTASNTSSTGFAVSDILDGGSGDVVSVSFDIDITNGSPGISLRTALSGGSTASNGIVYTSSGSKTATLTGNKGYVGIGFTEGDAPSNFTVSNFKIIADGFVKIWYDQSVTTQAGDTATGNHAVQATAASQPKIVSAGALNTSGGLEFDGSDDFFSLTSNISFENKAGCVFSLQDGQDSSNDFTLGRTDNNRGIGFRNIQTRWFYTTGAIDIDNSSPPSGLALFTALHDGTTNDPNVKAFVNGSLIVDGSPDANQGEVNVSTTANQIGARRALSFLEGTVKEIVIYDTNQTDNRGAIEANIGEAYSITGIPAYDDEVDGFVETWYDQSGNSKDATQATASKQPKIVNAGSYLSELNFDGANYSLNSINLISSLNSASAFIVAKTADDTLSGKTPVALSGGSDRFYIPVISSGSYYFGYDASSTAIEIGDADTDYHLFTGIAGSSNAEGFMDGQSGGTLTSVSDYTALIAGGIGAINNTQSWNGGIREVVVYNSDQSANRTALETNIAAANGVTLS